jgi:polyhydroxybutyrate depolymerase
VSRARARLAACCALLTALPACAPASQPSLPSVRAGNQEFDFEHGGRERSYRVHAPRALGPRPAPVVLSFHGGGGSAEAQQSYTRLDALADREGFLAVYPNGTGRLGKRLLTWNAGACCGWAKQHEIDDVGFARAVVDDLARRTPVDRARIYATGLSNGAMLAYRLAAEAPDLVAAIAPVAGSMVLERFEPARPVPILHIHSVDDPRALYAGGLGLPFPLTKARVLHPPVEEVLARWVRFEGCPEPPRAEPPRVGAGASAGHTATKLVWGPCRGGSEIALWRVTGAGHVWPGGKLDYLRRLLGPGTGVIDANEEMWRFFARFALPAAAPADQAPASTGP